LVLGVNPVKELVNTPDPGASDVWSPDTVGPEAIPQQTPRAVMSAPPSATTFPPLVAVVDVIAEVYLQSTGCRLKSIGTIQCYCRSLRNYNTSHLQNHQSQLYSNRVYLIHL